MTPAERIAALEADYLAARTARDRLDVARATGLPEDLSQLDGESCRTLEAFQAALEQLPAADAGALADDDRRALETMRAGMVAAASYDLPVAPIHAFEACADRDEARRALEAGGDTLQEHVESCFATLGENLRVGDERMTRVQLIGRLGREPDADARRALFLALQPLWETVDGDGGDASPYRVLVAESAAQWRRGHSPIAANAAALGVSPDDIETWAMTALTAWRDAFVDPARLRGDAPIEPWDWWWAAGELQRAVDPIPVSTALEVNAAYAAALGADLRSLGITFDTQPRPGRPAIAMAFTTFGARPHARPDGTWATGRPSVVMTDFRGGYAELGELVHETGHALHIAGIRSRPAFADWPDSDAFIEALADVLALDLTEPTWLRRWLPGAQVVPEATAIRCRYADVALDAAWAVFELRMHAAPDQRPNDVWTDITGTWLGIAPHPEWSWWAIRGQLVESPGYMSNYAVGAVLATSIRAAMRDALGDWVHGDRRWYPWLRDRVYRYGLERPSRDVLHDVLGRAPTADALLAEIGRGTRRA